MSYERYKENINQAKRAVRVTKVNANERWGRKMTERFHENKMFWKEVLLIQRIRKGISRNEVRVKTDDGTILIEKEAVKERSAVYFEGLLDVEEDKEDRKAEIIAVGLEHGVKVLGGLTNAHITKERVKGTVKEMKAGKAAKLDGCAVECLKRGGKSIIEWLVRLLDVCFVISIVPVDWMSACSLYESKGDTYECDNFSGISLLSVVDRKYDRVLL